MTGTQGRATVPAIVAIGTIVVGIAAFAAGLFLSVPLGVVAGVILIVGGRSVSYYARARADAEPRR